MKFSLSDALVTCGTGLVSALLLTLFFSDLNAVANRIDETPLGTIFFKKQDATRKSSDSQNWERLRNASPVYQDDTLRTDQDSEAVVNFDDGMSLDMFQNSMLKLTIRGQTTNLDFKEGSITLHGGVKGTPVALGQNGHTVSLSADAQLVVTKAKDTTSLELSQGTAQVSDSHGHQQTITTATAMDLADTGAAVVRKVDLIPQVPEPGARLLSQNPGTVPVKFAYEVPSSEKLMGQIEIQVAPSEDFSTPTAFPAPSGGAVIPLDPGTWYWRVVSGDTHSSTRQLSLSREDKLAQIQPEEASAISYRKKEPSVRFSWTASEHAAFWDLELTNQNDNFKNPVVRRRATVSSLVVDGLKAGHWAWRVIPHYAGTLVSGDSAPSVGHFTIVQRPQMTPLVPTLPVDGSLVQIQDLSTKGLAFTWEPPAEAKHYELTAYRSRAQGAAPVAKFETSSPYRILTPQELGDLVGVGKTYWALRWFDDEDNASPTGPLWETQAVDGSLALRPTFPPDGYRVSDRFVTNTRFNWKSNLPTRTMFQVSATQDFKDVLFEQQVKSETILGSNWGTGTYYWRLSSYNVNGSIFLQTEPRRFDVVPPFAPVQLVQPLSGALVYLPESKDLTASWPAVKDADYYSVTLLEASSGGVSRVSYQTTVEQTNNHGNPTVELPLGKLPEGGFVARVQAFAREKDTTTSIIGLYGDTPFTYKRLKFIQLDSPANNEVIEGLAARRRGVILGWSTVNLPPDATVVLKNLSDGREVLNLPVHAVSPTKIPRLPAGEYSWTVKGHLQGFDVSALAPNHFTVLPIPPLPAVSLLSPPDQTVYGSKELRNLKTLEFAWVPVPQAQEYLFSLFRSDSLLDPKPPVFQVRSSEPKATLPKLSILRKGEYYWEVQSRTLDATGEVEQVGAPVRSRFVINLPVLAAPQLPTGQVFYGR